MTGMFDRKWKGCTSVPKHWEFFKWTSKIFETFDPWLKRITCWCVISLRWCLKMAIHKYYAILLKRKKSFIAHPWCLQSVVGLQCIRWGWSAVTAQWSQGQLLGLGEACGWTCMPLPASQLIHPDSRIQWATRGWWWNGVSTSSARRQPKYI